MTVIHSNLNAPNSVLSVLRLEYISILGYKSINDLWILSVYYNVPAY